ncbi:MAG: tRNA (adenosine(37)-N6)-threonylcarbamoyltransferase complex transferase subunit TsaD [Alphaproteobacteria bacterium]
MESPEPRLLTVLGIESSCDETAAAVVRGRPGAVPEILSNRIFSQVEAHAPYAGVVPEIAARAHVERMDGLVAEAMAEAGLDFPALDGVAVTAGPGLIGGLIVGLMTAKGIAAVHDLPLIGVNHLEGHALSPRLLEAVDFPWLLLLISGGHCQLLTVHRTGRYTRHGTTIDDAAGEAFDKTAKLLGLGYPGGPAVERAAQTGNADRFAFPRPLAGRAGADFSFSGLKTSVRHAAEGCAPCPAQDVADICASFQAAVAESLADRTRNAMRLHEEITEGKPRTLVVAGGVAANSAVRAELKRLAGAEGYRLIVPPIWLCTDNAAMIAWAGVERLALGLTDGFDLAPRARWPLDEEAARTRDPRPTKSARRGAKA